MHIEKCKKKKRRKKRTHVFFLLKFNFTSAFVLWSALAPSEMSVVDNSKYVYIVNFIWDGNQGTNKKNKEYPGKNVIFQSII